MFWTVRLLIIGLIVSIISIVISMTSIIDFFSCVLTLSTSASRVGIFFLYLLFRCLGCYELVVAVGISLHLRHT